MIKKPVLSSFDAIKLISTGDVIMVGGFMGCGSPPDLLEALKQSDKELLTLVCNDCGIDNPDKNLLNGVAGNVRKSQFIKIITSHIGLNHEIQRQMINNETEVELVPQGTLAEKIRSAGCGLGGFLTPTGVGTEVECNKEVLEVGGRKYLLEYPLSGDIALLHAGKADEAGNLQYSSSARNFGPLMAMACKTVIVQADEIVEIGEIDPNNIITPSIFVDYIVKTEKKEAAFGL